MLTSHKKHWPEPSLWIAPADPMFSIALDEIRSGAAAQVEQRDTRASEGRPMNAAPAAPPARRCACSDCSRITLRVRCERHRVDVDEHLVAALRNSQSRTEPRSTAATATATEEQ